jgi:hypothetical protein
VSQIAFFTSSLWPATHCAKPSSSHPLTLAHGAIFLTEGIERISAFLSKSLVVISATSPLLFSALLDAETQTRIQK